MSSASYRITPSRQRTLHNKHVVFTTEVPQALKDACTKRGATVGRLSADKSDFTILVVSSKYTITNKLIDAMEQGVHDIMTLDEFIEKYAQDYAISIMTKITKMLQKRKQAPAAKGPAKQPGLSRLSRWL